MDFNKDAMETFKLNHPRSAAFCGDISELSNLKLKKLLNGKQVDIVVGGPPCQGFSTVGPGNPDDDRNKLFLQFVRIVKATKPLYVVLENVTGLLAKKNESTLQEIFRKFSRLGYHMDARVLHSEDYGVAEKRRRTIIIGSLINHEIEYPKPKFGVRVGRSFVPVQTVGDVITRLSDNKKTIHNHDIELAKPKSRIDLKRIQRIPEGKGIRYPEDEKKYLTKSLYLDIDWQKIREGRLRQTKYYRLDRHKPSPTIMTHRHTYFHPTENRYLTQREAAAIQSFPNNFIFSGSVSSQWRQIGNAVPPLMAKHIGLSLKSMFKRALKHEQARKTRRLKQDDVITTIRSRAFNYR